MNTGKTALFGALLAASLLGGVSSAHAAQAITFTGASDYYQESGATGNIVGWSFTANQDLYTTKLAVFDTDRDVSPEQSHFIGLWQDNGFDAQGNKLAATLLRSATVFETPGLKPSGFGYLWTDIASTTLKAGQTYIVGAVMGSDYYTAQVPESIFGMAPTPFENLYVDPLITYGSDAFYNLATLANTTNTSQLIFGSASLADTIIGGFGANIDVVATPIPAAAYLLGSGLVGLAGLRRRKK
jgi:hypothetical protein